MSETTWFRLQESLQKNLTKDEFTTWIQPLRVEREERRQLTLRAPNDRFLSTLEESFRPVVDRTIAGLEGPGFQVLFTVDGAESGNQAQASPRGQGLDGRQDLGTRTETPRRSRADAPRRSRAEPARNSGASAARRPRADPARRPRTSAARRALNDGYRFDGFVVGNSNQFAYAAARAVAESPGQSYNPLFLYGGVGLGKTHLLHAVAQEIQQASPDCRLLYLSAEQFVNELINSIRFDRMPAFRERYRTIDVLLVDDVQFLANKERTQEEFFHTFNTLYSRQRQIVLSSDAPPKDIPTLEERLRSRFEWGLLADIQPPDLETKVAILRRKAELADAELPDPVAMFIAQQVKSNVRELEGLLNRVLAFSSLTGRRLDLDLARETLRDILRHEDQRTVAGDVIKAVARHYGLKVSEIKSKSNSRQIAFPRQVAMFLLKEITELSFPEIGKLFNNKHHSTVMYSVEKISRLRQEDNDLEHTLGRFRSQLGA